MFGTLAASKKMIEKSESFHKSFNEDFCTYLEFYLTEIFANSVDQELQSFWCDGVSWAPYHNHKVNHEYLSYQNVSEKHKIVTTAWIGTTGQDLYEMTIELGENALERYKNEKSMIDCIPDKEVTDWIDIDPEGKTIKIRLK
jgi:hypothetical protein